MQKDRSLETLAKLSSKLTVPALLKDLDDNGNAAKKSKPTIKSTIIIKPSTSKDEKGSQKISDESEESHDESEGLDPSVVNSHNEDGSEENDVNDSQGGTEDPEKEALLNELKVLKSKLQVAESKNVSLQSEILDKETEISQLKGILLLVNIFILYLH